MKRAHLQSSSFLINYSLQRGQRTSRTLLELDNAYELHEYSRSPSTAITDTRIHINLTGLHKIRIGMHAHLDDLYGNATRNSKVIRINPYL